MGPCARRAWCGQCASTQGTPWFPLATGLLSEVAVTYGQPQSNNLKRKIPEINHSCILHHLHSVMKSHTVHPAPGAWDVTCTL